eukprot:2399305-Alexandrium_andersonii.AAC.1
MWAWGNVRKVLQQLQGGGNGDGLARGALQPAGLDLSDGAVLPWWLLLGHTGKIFGLVDRGITGIFAQGDSLRLVCTDGVVRVHAGGRGRLEVHDV